MPPDGLSGPPERWNLDGVVKASAAVVAEAVRLVPVDGAAVVLIGHGSRWHPSAATSAALAAAVDLQSTVGEGPSIEAHRSGGPVLVPNLAAAATRWPALSAAGPMSGAYFSLPLRIGTIRLGVLDLHRSEPGRLAAASLATALHLADVASAALVHSPDLRDLDEPGASGTGYRPEIDQATGMLTVFLGVDLATAYARLRAHAFATGLPLVEVAAAVIAGTLHFDADGGQPDGSR